MPQPARWAWFHSRAKTKWIIPSAKVAVSDYCWSSTHCQFWEKESSLQEELVLLQCYRTVTVMSGICFSSTDLPQFSPLNLTDVITGKKKQTKTNQNKTKKTLSDNKNIQY